MSWNIGTRLLLNYLHAIEVISFLSGFPSRGWTCVCPVYIDIVYYRKCRKALDIAMPEMHTTASDFPGEETDTVHKFLL